MRHGRRDTTHKMIVKTLRDIGASVEDTADIGGGFPDLVVGYKGRTLLLEVKGPLGRLRASQSAFQARWRGSAVVVVRTRREAIEACLIAVGVVVAT